MLEEEESKMGDDTKKLSELVKWSEESGAERLFRFPKLFMHAIAQA